MISITMIEQLLVVAMGLAIGSFLNVVIYRTPRGVSIARGFSFCPNCKNQLRWFHNIPLISFLILKGQCAFCKESISFQYPGVELFNMLLYLAFYEQLGLEWSTLPLFFLGSALIVIIFVDFKFQIIPDSLTLPGMIIALAASFLPNGLGITQSLIGLVLGGGSLYLLAMFGDLLFKKESMGGGDIKMMAMLGAFLGWKIILLIFLVAPFLGVVTACILGIFSKRFRQSRTMSFGPFLSVAAMIAILYGEELIALYLKYVM